MHFSTLIVDFHFLEGRHSPFCFLLAFLPIKRLFTFGLKKNKLQVLEWFLHWL